MLRGARRGETLFRGAGRQHSNQRIGAGKLCSISARKTQPLTIRASFGRISRDGRHEHQRHDAAKDVPKCFETPEVKPNLTRSTGLLD